MNPRFLAITGAALAAVGGLSFAAGRMTMPEDTQASPVFKTETIQNSDETETMTPLKTVSPGTIAQAPFDAAYETLRNAEPKSLTRWVKEIQQIPEKPKRIAAVVSFFRTLIQFNPEAAKDLFFVLEKDERWAALIAARDAAPPKALRQVSEILQTYDWREVSSCSWDLRSDVIDTWSKADPIAAKEFLEEHPGNYMGRAFSALVRNWAAYDPEAAFAWIIQQTEEAKTRPREEYEQESEPGWLLAEWAKGFFEHDRAAALDYLVAHPEPYLEETVRDVGGELFAESPEEARKFILRLNDKQGADALWGVGLMIQGMGFGDANAQVRAPQFAADWMVQFPAPQWGLGMDFVLHDWKEKNSPELFVWMARQPADTQEALAPHYVDRLTKEGAEEGFKQVLGINDLSLRNLLLQQLARSATTDESRVAVAAELEKAALDPTQKQYLLSLIPPEPLRALENQIGQEPTTADNEE